MTLQADVRCELLSNYYLCSGKNNVGAAEPIVTEVVNCFRITIFAVAKTILEIAVVAAGKL